MKRIDDDRLDAYEVVLIIGTCCGRGAVIDGTTWWAVDLSRWVRDFGVVGFQFGDGVGDVVWVQRAGIVGEFAAPG